MSLDRHLLAIIGKRLPAIYDVIPRGPQDVTAGYRRSEAALNPQPLPPVEIGAALAAEFVRTAWMANRFGPNASNAFEDLDDWCPTSPKKIKLPAWWPPIPDPDPHPNWFTDFQIGFVTRLAAASTQFENTTLGQAFDKAIDRTVSSMKTGNTRM